ncbi:MAG: WG repeat-containing protein [Odoribacter splanchnicus]
MMIKVYTVILFLFAGSASLQAQTLYKVEKNGFYGYVNAMNDTVIACEYIHVYTDSIKTLGFVFDSKKKKIICFNNKGERLFYVFKYDNGPDYIRDGLFRIMNNKGLVGFADLSGNVVIEPQFKFAFPFCDGKAKVTFRGRRKKVPGSYGTIHYWDSKNWFYIDEQGFQIKQ